MGNADPRPKRICIFIDGTWNRPDADHPTNVVRLARAVRHRDDGDMPQVVIYSPGVGSGVGNNLLARRLDRMLGGTMGWGLLSLMEEVYRRLIFIYQPGDEIMVFGFSRGAFAARSLVGLIRSCGVPGPEKLSEVPKAIARYTARGKGFHPNDEGSHAFRAEFAPAVATSGKELEWRRKNGKRHVDVVRLAVAYLGVWDTVSALGIPAFLPGAARFNAKYQFHDAKLSSMVRAARHAVSIDERRKTFPAYLWDNMDVLNEESLMTLVPEYLQQWFPGNHGSVGGGGPQLGLSSAALTWVMLGAAKHGLAVDWAKFRAEASHFDVEREPLDNKFGPSGLAGLLNVISRDRAGPQELSQVSMAAVDRWHADESYRRNPVLSKVYAELFGMDEAQRAAMREAHRITDGALTHEPGKTTWPGPPVWAPPEEDQASVPSG